MELVLNLHLPDPETMFERRKCGCFRVASPDIVHWWRFTRIRLRFRRLQGLKKYLQILWESRSHQKACEITARSIIPMMVGMGIMDPCEGLSEIRELEGRKDRWNQWEKDQLMIGASSDHPDGIYAHGGDDLVSMSSEEFNHWYG